MAKNKKIGKISPQTRVNIPNPFSISTHKTERTSAAILMHWMRDIIESKGIDLGLPDVETGGGDRRFPDTVIYKTRRSQDVLCVMEFKPPQWDPFNEDDPKEPARKKATDRHAKYFTTSNFRELILWNTERVNAAKPEEEQIVERYHLSDVYDLDRIEDSRYQTATKTGLERFLNDLYELSTGKKAEPRLAIDELLIFRLQEKIKKLAYYYQSIIYDEAHKNRDFAKNISRWFTDQGWSFFIENEVDYKRVSRQTAYLLVNKILFYNALQLKRPDKLPPLEIPKDITQGGLLRGVLQSYFNQVLKIDYETIYTTDFIDEIAFPESREVVEEIKELINVLKRYDFATLGFDVIGRIFERLIPEEERHNLGQYFTNPDVVDLILQFCIQRENDKVFDPSCGAGTFLVRAYQQKKLMNQRLSHEEIIDTLWGNDIAKFPAHLATINLAINNLSVEKNYPRIIRKDFFDLLSFDDKGFQLPEDVRKVMLKTMSKEGLELVYPRWFEAIVGNPPYTRQEEISEISGEETYKEKLIEKALSHPSGISRKSTLEGPYASISKRAGIYAYFFIHGTKFLQNGGRFGFVVSNSWLDVEYGAGLQEFFLKNYKIIAIIESKVERWFEDADINTVIVILEKAAGKNSKKERDDNIVRFVYLLKRLRDFIPPAQNIWSKQVERKQAIDDLIKTILAHSDFYQNNELRIFPKKQSELWEEGFDTEEQKYVGTKWGKYIRAPKIFFKILEKGKDKLVLLKQIANVRFGIKTGANEFFYLTEEEIKRKKIEKEFWMHKNEKGDWVPNFIIKSPRECKSILVDPKDLKYRVLMVHKDKNGLKGTNVLKYITEGERKGFHQRPTCANRERWYDLEEIKGDILCMMSINERHIWWDNKDQYFIDARLYGTTIKEDKYKILGRSLNSTLFWLFTELWGRVNLGEGALDVKVYEYASIPVLKFDDRLNRLLQNSIAQRKINNVFEELGAKNPNEVSLSQIKSDRRKLDQLVMGEVLGLTEDEQLDVYRATIDLVKSRIEKARSVSAGRKTKSGIDTEAVINIVVQQIGDKNLKNWYKEKVLSQHNLGTKQLPELEGKPKIEKSLFDWQVEVDKKTVQCRSEIEARYCKVWVEVGIKSVKIPKDEKYLAKITPELELRKVAIDEIIESYLGSILDYKLKSQILHQVWQKII